MRFDLSDYEPVDVRIHRFYADHPEGRIVTYLHSRTDQEVTFYVEVYRAGEEVAATGWASETVGSSPVNRTNALENAETSAIGRALANLGYSAKSRPSREEMESVQRSDDEWSELLAAVGTEEEHKGTIAEVKARLADLEGKMVAMNLWKPGAIETGWHKFAEETEAGDYGHASKDHVSAFAKRVFDGARKKVQG